MQYLANILIVFLMVLLANGCARNSIAPVESLGEIKFAKPRTTQSSDKQQRNLNKDTANYHHVVVGDTLYSIAWRYQLDYKNVAKWNQIAAPYTIYPGQTIHLKPKTLATEKREIAAQSLSTTQTAKPKAKQLAATAEKKSEVRTQQARTNLVALPQGSINWKWPTNGKVVTSNSPKSKKGIDIIGQLGQSIKASAAGKVVYSGNGLIGFGNLIIIKHNETYLSAYAYNSEILVKEGDLVSAGQSISRMGKNSIGTNMLHFEIRKNGKSIDPIKFLPNRKT